MLPLVALVMTNQIHSRIQIVEDSYIVEITVDDSRMISVDVVFSDGHISTEAIIAVASTRTLITEVDMEIVVVATSMVIHGVDFRTKAIRII
jgi:hypothetical protein